MNETLPTRRRFEDGETTWDSWEDQIFKGDESHQCPTYVHRAPPCQGSCPSGHDIRGWLSIASGIDKPLGEMSWQQYAFQRMVAANPFPAIMGRVCPAPCEVGCNRNEVDEPVGINLVEQYVGDWALENTATLDVPGEDTGKRVAIIGGGPAGLSAAYFLRLRGHACTIFEAHPALGGLMRYGIPGYRTPEEVLDGEIQRILDMGVETQLDTTLGVDVELEKIEKEYDAIFWAIGTQLGKPLPITGAEAPNCVDGVSFLRAFNEGRLQHMDGRVVVVGAGDTAMDVAAVARRIGQVSTKHKKVRPDSVILGHTVQDVASVARRQGADVWVVCQRPVDKEPATKHELDAIIREGAEIHECLDPVEVIRDAEGRATALKVVPVVWDGGDMSAKEGEEFEIECSLIVGAIGQGADFTGFEELDNGKGLINADENYRVVDRPGQFVGGDVIRPHLLTTAIGQASIAVEGIDKYFREETLGKRPKVDVHHFNLLDELRTHDLEPNSYDQGETRGTCDSDFAVHNYENRSFREIIKHGQMYLGHFQNVPMNRRLEVDLDPKKVLGNFEERYISLIAEKAVAEAKRCMCCGMCLQCNNCVTYCPQDAVFRVNKDERATGRYVDTDYGKCIGCHICADVCPSGYIDMGLGE